MIHLRHLFSSHPALESVGPEIEAAFGLLRDCVRGGGKILACGNGGSASDAEHLVGELMKGFNLRRPLTVEQTRSLAAAFPEDGEALAGKLQGAIPAISLASQTSLMTAIANDTDPEMIFAQQVLGIGKAGDVLIGISTSGNSRNVVAAAKVARAFGVKVVALTGESGGALAPLADVAVRVPARHVATVQELHLPIYHWLCASLEEAFFGEGTGVSDVAVAAAAALSHRTAPALPKAIGLIVFDFDGVFTDNKVYTTQDGVEMVVCDRADGLGLDWLRARKLPMLILSTETNPVVAARAAKLKLALEAACGDKAAFLRRYMAERGIDPQSVVYVGNDVNDLDAMRLVGFTAAPADAHPDVRRHVSLCLSRPGGQGAVREFCEFILRKVDR